jgi:hypothetical protein
MRKNKKIISQNLLQKRNFDSKSWKIEAGMRYSLSFFSTTQA